MSTNAEFIGMCVACGEMLPYADLLTALADHDEPVDRLCVVCAARPDDDDER
jgi:hypothetical protein